MNKALNIHVLPLLQISGNKTDDYINFELLMETESSHIQFMVKMYITTL